MPQRGVSSVAYLPTRQSLIRLAKCGTGEGAANWAWAQQPVAEPRHARIGGPLNSFHDAKQVGAQPLKRASPNQLDPYGLDKR